MSHWREEKLCENWGFGESINRRGMRGEGINLKNRSFGGNRSTSSWDTSEYSAIRGVLALESLGLVEGVLSYWKLEIGGSGYSCLDELGLG